MKDYLKVCSIFTFITLMVGLLFLPGVYIMTHFNPRDYYGLPIIGVITNIAFVIANIYYFMNYYIHRGH